MIKKIITIFSIIFIAFNANYIFVKADFSVNQDNTAKNILVEKLSQQIKEKRENIKKMSQNEKIYKEKIEQAYKKRASLANQLSIFSNRLEEIKLNIQSIETDIDKTNLEIQRTTIAIAEKEKNIADKKSQLENFIRLIYQSEQKSYLEIMLLNDSLSDFFDQIHSAKVIQNELKNTLIQLELAKSRLKQKEMDLQSKNKKLTVLKNDLEERKQSLVEEQNTKKLMIAITKNSERRYQNLLWEEKQERLKANAEIISLEKKVRKLIEQQSNKKIQLRDNGLIWPIEPTRGISCYFHDPNYPFRYLFEHPGIDIRAYQGTDIRAAGSGYVARAKDNGYGYSYIMIVHANGLATVYGHVSKILVKQDSYVVQGQIIGKSGGMPGTRGAGRLTTGPHLHFEVRLNGIPVNPLEYLPKR